MNPCRKGSSQGLVENAQKRMISFFSLNDSGPMDNPPKHIVPPILVSFSFAFNSKTAHSSVHSPKKGPFLALSFFPLSLRRKKRRDLFFSPSSIRCAVVDDTLVGPAFLIHKQQNVPFHPHLQCQSTITVLWCLPLRIASWNCLTLSEVNSNS